MTSHGIADTPEANIENATEPVESKEELVESIYGEIEEINRESVIFRAHWASFYHSHKPRMGVDVEPPD